MKEVAPLKEEDGQVEEVAPSSKLEVYPSGVRRLKREEKQHHFQSLQGLHICTNAQLDVCVLCIDEMDVC